ncbi:hypothetical protein LJ754_02390 [Arthrobacter sp. zg-Y40]|uniref:hypothetical protein n=1 Tax=Arthrobacter sp. zg-Y40 TaxID=2886939 RepID=UPI001D13F177|nr:hypothetical protein [Arthrobacter sp. zg-Y40]MCC3278008.1 hypothetical protein [Arthrobacter sp. zg-Y40]
MTDQLWAIGGVVAGIVATGGMNLFVERRKLRISGKEAARELNKNRCEALLKSVEDELAGAYSYEEEHGVFPIDNGYEPSPANARILLTDIELHCPPLINRRAMALIKALEGHVWADVKAEEYQAARKEFIQAFRKL